MTDAIKLHYGNRFQRFCSLTKIWIIFCCFEFDHHVLNKSHVM